MVKFFETEAQITEAQILELENKLSFKFPVLYKNHLLKYNGGRCTPNVFGFKENGVYTESSVDWFLAVSDGEYDNLEKEFEVLKIDEKRMPSSFFPIANDPGGNCICINAADGKIYFWDHENEVDYNISDDSDHSNLYLIAENLDEFILNLKEL